MLSKVVHSDLNSTNTILNTDYRKNSEPYMLAQQTGVWEVFYESVQNNMDDDEYDYDDDDDISTNTTERTRNGYARQVVTQKPIAWCDDKRRQYRPIAVIGDTNWYIAYHIHFIPISPFYAKRNHINEVPSTDKQHNDRWSVHWCTCECNSLV